MIEWLRVLGLPEEEFRKAIRPYFADTGQMNMYIEERRPLEVVRYERAIQDVPSNFSTPTKPFFIEELQSGHYKGRHGKR